MKLQWFENICVFYIYFVLGFWSVMSISMAAIFVQSVMR